jgi:acyl carrier protein
MPSPSRADVLQAIERALDALEVERGEGALDDTTPLFEGGLELDSFTVVELLGRVEDQFAMAFADDDFTRDRFTVGGLAGLVVAHLEERA